MTRTFGPQNSPVAVLDDVRVRDHHVTIGARRERDGYHLLQRVDGRPWSSLRGPFPHLDAARRWVRKELH